METEINNTNSFPGVGNSSVMVKLNLLDFNPTNLEPFIDALNSEPPNCLSKTVDEKTNN